MGRIKRVVSIVILGLLCVAVFGFSQTTRRAQSNDSEYWEVGEWEIQDPIEETWYLGCILPTDSATYILTTCGSSSGYKFGVFQVYVNNSTGSPTTLRVGSMDKFLIGSSLYQLETSDSDWIQVRYLGTPLGGIK